MLHFLIIISFPILLILSILIIPLVYLYYFIQPSSEEKKVELKKRFLKYHLLDDNNLSAVENWFELWYKNFKIKYDLFSIPPLARNWAVGYTPALDNYAEELTTPNYQHRIKSCYDREKEIEKIEAALSKSDLANVIIVGEEGVGKHTIVDTLSKKIYEGKTTPQLAYKRVLVLNLEKILNQTTDQKQRESFLEDLFEEACQAKNIILVINNFESYVRDYQDSFNITIPLEKYAKTDLVQFIAITEPFHYQKFVFPNEKLVHLFEKITVYEISKEDALNILLEKSLYFENYYKVIIPYETIINTIEKSDFFITDIPFPEKALNLLDLACVEGTKKGQKIIYPKIIDEIITQKTRVPTELTDEFRRKLLSLEENLYIEILQQEEAIKSLSSAMRRAFILYTKRKKPIGTFLFLGPTGVGKTQTAKSLTKIFFGDEKYLSRFDMSNYQMKEDVPKLIDFLTLKINQNPYGVLLLDEIEKANPDLINIFLTIFDEGYFTNYEGKKIDCKNLIIIATSNAGSDYIFKTIVNKNYQIATSDIINYLVSQKIFLPEFLNRFDDIVVFKPLTQETIKSIAKNYLKKIKNDLEKIYGIKIFINENTIDAVSSLGFDMRFGARNLERIIRKTIEDKLTKYILEKKPKPNEEIYL